MGGPTLPHGGAGHGGGGSLGARPDPQFPCLLKNTFR